MPRERRSRLETIARALVPERGPYYRWTSSPPAEPAAGWYWIPKGLEHPVFLGANSVDAELKLRAELERKRETEAVGA